MQKPLTQEAVETRRTGNAIAERASSKGQWSRGKRERGKSCYVLEVKFLFCVAVK